ncbi:MAG TPA: hypothetical protein VNE63_19400 [Candidatus Acidoferrales bacterium]|nr:hypothetical protein [Candidatus Acidoferrales bacterium]
MGALFGTFAKSPIREMVAKARKAGVVAIEAKDNEGVKICHDILVPTRRRLSLPPMPFHFIAAMRSHLSPQHMKIFLALHEGKPVACHLVLTARDL